MGALDGLRVLDLTWNLPGPYATSILASMGADVVKVEPPRGDPARHTEPLFSMLNAGKRSVVLDLRAGVEDLRALVERADVLVEGFRPGVMARLGCGPDVARAWNPRLVWCSISAYGQDGPRAKEPGHDLNAQALAGLAWLERDAADRPRETVLPVADLSASQAAVSAILGALYARERTGEGTVLDVAMTDAATDWARIWGEGVDLAGPARRRPGARLLGPLVRRLERVKLYALPSYGLFPCRDGRWLALGVVDEDPFWKGLCTALRIPGSELKLPGRILLGPALRPLVALRLRTRDRADWLRRLGDAGVPATPVHDPADARQEPQLAGRARERGGRAPALGEHTAEILARW